MKRPLTIVISTCLVPLFLLLPACENKIDTSVETIQDIAPSTTQITIPTTTQIVIPATPSTQAETPLNPWPTVWPSETIDSDGITRTYVVHPSPPMISLEESTMVFITGNKVNPPIQTRSISANYDDISWAVTTDVPWLVISPNRGIASPANKLISVAIDVSSLAPGNYVGHINITADAFNSPRLIPVQLTIQH